MSNTVELRGLEKTIRKLESLPKKVRRNANKKAVRAGGAVFLKAARAAAPRRTGLFARSVTQKIKSYKNTHVSMIGQNKQKSFGKAAEVARKRKGRGGISGRGDLVPIHLVDQPTGAHDIDGPSKIFGRWVKGIKHPGTRGANFISRAGSQARSPALSAFRAKLQAEVDIEARKAA